MCVNIGSRNSSLLDSAKPFPEPMLIFTKSVVSIHMRAILQGLLMNLCRVFNSVDFTRICHDDVIKGGNFPRYWPFVRGIHRSPVNSPHKGQSRGALMFSLICAWKKRLSKQWWGWWFETPSHPNDVIVMSGHMAMADTGTIIWLLQWQWSNR